MMTISGSNMSSSCGGSYPEDPSSSTTWKQIYHNPFFYNKPLPNNKKLQLPPPPHQLRRRPSSAGEMEREEMMRFKIKDDANTMRWMQMEELKVAVEQQRRARRRSEHLNKRLIKELNKERRRREAAERVCEKMRKDMEEERRMLWMAHLLREERVQMKLAEAKIFLEEKMSQLQIKNSFPKPAAAMKEMTGAVSAATYEGGAKWNPRRPEKKLMTSCNDDGDGDDKSSSSSSKKKKKKSVLLLTTRKAVVAGAAESERRPAKTLPENPHIKRGIKGFVEFPRSVARAVGGSKISSRHKLVECQKQSQIRILLKQPNRFATGIFLRADA